MTEISHYLINLFMKMLEAVGTSLVHNWLPLSLAILTAVAMKVFVDTEKLKNVLMRKTKASILASVAFGAFTPLCACGTMAVILGLMTTALPWGPIMAFLTSSPLMSPDGFIMLAGVIGFKFAAGMAAASVIIGLGSGFLTHLIEKKTNFLKGQSRFIKEMGVQACGCGETGLIPVQACGCGEVEAAAVQACCSSGTVAVPEKFCCATGALQMQATLCCTSENGMDRGKMILRRLRLPELGEALLTIGLKQILLFFTIFVAVGYLINSFIPTDYIMALFSADNIYSVPLAAIIGLPLYISGESAIPLIQALMEGGAGGGALMAFLITGAGTSAWVIAGVSAFMKGRVIGLYVGFLLVGGILLGYLYDLLIALGI